MEKHGGKRNPADLAPAHFPDMVEIDFFGDRAAIAVGAGTKAKPLLDQAAGQLIEFGRPA